MTLRFPRRRAAVAVAIGLGIAVLDGCTVLPPPQDTARLHAGIQGAIDSDRSAAARVAAGLGAAQTGVSLTCTMLNDMPGYRMLAPVRRYCAARRGLVANVGPARTAIR